MARNVHYSSGFSVGLAVARSHVASHALEIASPQAYTTAAMTTADETAKKQFDQDDREWNGPRLIGLGAVTLLIAISLIYFMSTTTGCSLQIVP